MLVKVKSFALQGLEPVTVEVEVDIANTGLPSFSIVGLPDAAVQESRERVRSALKNNSYQFPTHRITVNLAPADLKKEGSCYDLPIAIGILLASKQIHLENESESYFIGELSLDGSLREVNGILSMNCYIHDRKEKKQIPGWNGFFFPIQNYEEIVYQHDMIFPCKSLKEAVQYLLKQKLPSFTNVLNEPIVDNSGDDFQDIIGQEFAKRALEVAASGMHNILLTGPPGTGKTMLARRIPSILPSLSFDESVEVSQIYSAMGLLSKNHGLLRNRPFRSPHHSSSVSALLGGGSKPKPGEISLAHRGVLFLDEFPEFPRNVIHALRQPLEDGKVSISRIHSSVEWPAKFMLIAAMNPCPCGYYGDSQRECKCTPSQIQRYQSKIEGPIMDRIDIVSEVLRVDHKKLMKMEKSEPSSLIRERVMYCHAIQNQRFSEDSFFYNSEMNSRAIRQYCKLDPETEMFLVEIGRKWALSGRSNIKILKVARTIADMRKAQNISMDDICEALQYRYRTAEE